MVTSASLVCDSDQSSSLHSPCSAPVSDPPGFEPTTCTRFSPIDIEVTDAADRRSGRRQSASLPANVTLCDDPVNSGQSAAELFDDHTDDAPDDGEAWARLARRPRR